MQTLIFCNSTLAWGGGEKWHLDASLAMAEKGFRVFLLCHQQGVLYQKALLAEKNFKESTGQSEEIAGTFCVKEFSISRFSFLNPLVYCRMVRFFREVDAFGVIMNLPSDLKCVAPAAKKAGVRHIIYRRGSDIPVRDSFLNRKLYGETITRLITNSDATLESVLANNADMLAKEKITVLPNGIDIKAFDAALAGARPLKFPSETLTRKSTPHPVPAITKPIVIGNAGRLDRQKAQHILLYLGAELSHRGLPYRIVISGTGERGRELVQLAEVLGIKKHVTFTGFLDNLAPFWKAIDIFILTSLWEGFGFACVEAMLASKPVIAFNVSNLPDLVHDRENGLLLPLPDHAEGPGKPDIKALADAVVYLAEDAEAREAMGKAGRAFAEQNFDQQKAMATLYKLFEDTKEDTFELVEARLTNEI